MRPKSNTSQRFWSKVDKNGPVPAHAPHLGRCWLWTAGRHKSMGAWYGSFTVANRAKPAHRVAYELAVGPIRNGFDIDHKCRNTLCVRPDHLDLVTHQTNVLRGFGPTAINARKTHCKEGHAFDLFNTYIDPQGGRECRRCRAASGRRRQGRKPRGYCWRCGKRTARQRPTARPPLIVYECLCMSGR